MSNPSLKIELAYPDAQIPTRTHATDSCVDLYAHGFKKLIRNGHEVETFEDIPVEDLSSILLGSMDRVLVDTGIKATASPGYELQIRARSSAFNNGLMVVNGIGTIDEPYRGILFVALINASGTEQRIKHGDRIAQLAVCPIVLADIEVVKSLDETERGERGFGSTGKR